MYRDMYIYIYIHIHIYIYIYICVNIRAGRLRLLGEVGGEDRRAGLDLLVRALTYR